MKGLFLVPEIFSANLSPHHEHLHLFNMLHNFELRITDHCQEIPGDTEIIITFKSPQHSNPDTLMELSDLDKRIKLIGWVCDLHSWGNKAYEKNMARMLERDDLILCPYDEAFRKRWPQYVDKFIFFPHFFAPHDTYARLPFNEKPKMKCLLSGIIWEPAYPLRTLVRLKHDPGKVDILPHPGYGARNKDAYIGERYARALNGYFCAIATCSIFRYVVAKYFEIPAAGALLLAEEVSDLKKLGFAPYKHYVPVTKDNVFSQIDDCLAKPQKYERIRKTGREFVLANHSVINRFKQLEALL